jgi:hypothetical protein
MSGDVLENLNHAARLRDYVARLRLKTLVPGSAPAITTWHRTLHGGALEAAFADMYD